MPFRVDLLLVTERYRFKARIASLALSIGLISSLKRSEEGAHPKLTAGVYDNRCACNRRSTDARDKCGGMCGHRMAFNRRISDRRDCRNPPADADPIPL